MLRDRRVQQVVLFTGRPGQMHGPVQDGERRRVGDSPAVNRACAACTRRSRLAGTGMSGMPPSWSATHHPTTAAGTRPPGRSP